MMRPKLIIPSMLLLMILGRPAHALDPPHDSTNTIECSSCHTPHNAPGGAINVVAGNANLCQSCHVIGGPANNKPLAEADQALPGPGLPSGTTPGGTSHRWDSGASGHVEADAVNTSTGEVRSGGAFTGPYAKTYTITITTGGDMGLATFSWTDTLGGGASGLTTGSDVSLDEGITITFTDGLSAPSFVSGDVWRVYVRTDINQPTTPALAARVFDGKIVCSTCHDQHKQTKDPFDPAAPAYGGDGTGTGRHFQRIDNDFNQMCLDCHSARDVTLSSDGSHPVGVSIPGTGSYQSPASLPLDTASQVACMSCHNLHYTPTADGALLRLTNVTSLCTDCHTLSDTDTPASHLDASTGVLWPGGQYGSTFPEITDASRRGFCTNCHQPHGWPDDVMPGQDFPKLLVERDDLYADGSDPDDAEDICYTCHDSDGPAVTDIKSEFEKGINEPFFVYHHSVNDAEQTPGRSVECRDCHNPHQATSSNAIKGVTGIDIDGNPVGPGTQNNRQVEEYEICFKCHGDTYNDTYPRTTNKRLDFATYNSAFHPVVGPGRNTSTAMANKLLGGLTTSSVIKCTDCHNNEQTGDVQGPVSNSTARPKGPHGSTVGWNLRAYYWPDPVGPGTWDPANYALCFLCHDVNAFTDQNSNNMTNFNDGGDNFHNYHIVKEAHEETACADCHYNNHGSQDAQHTAYYIDGTLYPNPPPGYKTRLVSFSPDMTGTQGYDQPTFWINTSTRERRCYLVCHGAVHGKMMNRNYIPDSSGDDDGLIIP